MSAVLCRRADARDHRSIRGWHGGSQTRFRGPRYTATRRSHRTGAPHRSLGRTEAAGGSSSTRASNAFLDGALLRHECGDG